MRNAKYIQGNQLKSTAVAILIICIAFNECFSQDYIKPKVPVFNNLEVNTFNGNVFYSRQDFLVKGIMPINVSFYYNSISDTVDYGYGLGWFFHYGLNYRFDEDNNVVIVRGGGRSDVYTKDGSQYIPPVGYYDMLEEYEPQKFVLTLKSGLKYYFDDPSHKMLTGITDLNGNTIAITYNSDHPASITNSSGRTVTLNWTDDHLTGITYDNSSYSYAYQDDFLSEVVNPLNFSETYQYLASGKLAAITDFRNSPVYIEYNDDVVVKKIKSCDSEISFSFTDNKSYVIENGNSGKLITCYTYDEFNRIVEITNPLQNAITFEYDENNNIIKYTDFKGNSTIREYDSTGNVTSETNPAGYTIEATYNQFNKIETYTDRKGSTTTFIYNGNGNLLSIDQPLGVSYGFTYDGDGNIIQTTNPNNVTTSYVYDENHNLTHLNYPIGYLDINYDNRGNISDLTDTNNNSLFLEYDEKDQLTKVKVNDTIETNYLYDGNGNIRTEIDANGNIKGYGYDSQNRLIYVTIPAGITTYEYDQQDNLTKITDANGHITEYFYNGLNQLTLAVDPIGNQISYEYDANGNLTGVTDANGNSTIYTYNSTNQLLQKSYVGNTDHFSYDEEGNIINMYNDDINISFVYDALSRLTEKTVNTWNKTISYTYDPAGNRETMTDPDDGITHYYYDDANRLTSLVNPFNETTGFEYDNAGRVTKQTNANGTYADYSYNDWNWLTSIFNRKSNGDLISSFEYTYDRYGNRLTMLENETDLHQYTYDDSYQLKQVDYPVGDTEEFVYDGSGNRITYTYNGAPESYIYNEADQLLTAGNVSFTYDNNGNTISKTENGETTDYKYDGLNRLTEIIFPDGTNNEYKYCPTGIRISLKNIAEQTTYYFLDGSNVISELNNSGSTQARYTSSLGIDSWISTRRDNQTYYYHKNGLNSNTELTDVSQSIVNNYEYFAFGEIKSLSGNIINPYLYTGREFDLENGTYYYRTRFYNPNIARFNRKDIFIGTLVNPTSLNKYCYVDNNPINYFDPFGMNSSCPLPNFLKCIIPSKTNIISISCFLGCLYLAEAPPALMACLTACGIIYTTETALCIAKELQKYWKCAYGDLGNPQNIIPNDRFVPTGNTNSTNTSGGTIIGTEIIAPADPNEIIGPLGYDTAQWVSINENLAYTVLFENDPDFATAPAQNVYISVPIDSSLNMYNFRLSDFGFSNLLFQMPENLASYSTRLDVVDSLGLFVDITAGLNVQNREAFWLFESIDPVTGLPPADPMVGFLPVNDSLLANGEGFVSFIIKSTSTNQTGDTLRAFAGIVFDENESIETNTWKNIVDALPPESTVDPLPPAMSTTSFDISFSGTDDPDGCGIAKYQLYFSKNSDPWLLYGEYNPDTIIEFTGTPNSTYKFFSRAKDHVGNTEPMKTVADAMTTLEADTILVDIKAFLQGPYFNGQMTPFLNVLNYLPLEQPYDADPWDYNGTESVFSMPNFNIIDWVLVELIQFTDTMEYTVVGQRAGFLNFNGIVTDLDGISYLNVTVADTNDLYLCLHHRNHLRAYSAFPLTYSQGIYSYDFTINPNQYIGGSNVAKQLSSVLWGMLSGDANNDGQIDNNDKNDIWIIEEDEFGYKLGDFNMDSQVDDDDIIVKWKPNAGKGIKLSD